MGTGTKLYHVTLTSEGRRVLAKYKQDLVQQSNVEQTAPKIVGVKGDSKFLCGVDGNSIDSHPANDRGRLWMCNACGQVYCDSCLSSWPRTICIGSVCPSARQRIPLKTVLRKVGNW